MVQGFDRLSPGKYLTPNQVAALLRVSPVTVRHWASSGKLRCQSTPGGHRRFSYSDIEDFALSRGIRLADRQAPPYSVLVVDDNRELAAYLAELLTNLYPEIAVEVAHDGFEAGEKLHTFKPDVVLLDLLMPGLDGFETCRRIKQSALTRNVRVIAMTGYSTDQRVREILEAGAEACLIKPVRKAELVEALNMDAGTQSNLSSSMVQD